MTTGSVRAARAGTPVGVVEGLEPRLCLAAGTLDPSFGVGGHARLTVDTEVGDSAAAAVLQPDGKLVVCGLLGEGVGDDQLAVQRFDADGSLDLSFGDRGQVRFARAPATRSRSSPTGGS